MKTDNIFHTMDLPLISMVVKAKVSRRIIWNSFPGSVIHGVIGFKLKELSCVMAHKNCKKCFLANSCTYGFLYESLRPPDSERMKLYPQIPHPIRITIYPWDKPQLDLGDELEIGITLFGKAIFNALLVLISLEDMLREGIGRKWGGERGKAVIIAIRDILSGVERSWEKLKSNYSPISASQPKDLIETFPSKHNLKLRFKSPLKITTDGKPNFKPSFRNILSSLMRRLGNIVYFYGGEEIPINYKESLSVADKIEVYPDFHRVKAIRYSSRQNKTISISGTTGEMTIFDCPSDLSALLKLGQYIGVGKSTTMGLGDYELNELEK